MEKAPINRIINFSNVDGPGNRMSIFSRLVHLDVYIVIILKQLMLVKIVDFVFLNAP